MGQFQSEQLSTEPAYALRLLDKGTQEVRSGHISLCAAILGLMSPHKTPERMCHLQAEQPKLSLHPQTPCKLRAREVHIKALTEH